MGYDYDKLYSHTPNALGEPTKIFVDFFKSLGPSPLTVLDVGCCQGRDAVFIARLGHKVIGVDHSPCGIRDLEEAAKREGLDITGVVANLLDFTPDRKFDVILIDRALHMLKETPRLQCLRKLIENIAVDGWLLISDETKNIPALVELLDKSQNSWTTHTQKKGYLFCQRKG